MCRKRQVGRSEAGGGSGELERDTGCSPGNMTDLHGVCTNHHDY